MTDSETPTKMKRLSCSYHSIIDTSEFNASISKGVSGAVVDENFLADQHQHQHSASRCVGDLDTITSEGKQSADSLPMPLTGGVCDYLEMASFGTDDI